MRSRITSGPIELMPSPKFWISPVSNGQLADVVRIPLETLPPVPLIENPFRSMVTGEPVTLMALVSAAVTTRCRSGGSCPVPEIGKESRQPRPLWSD